MIGRYITNLLRHVFDFFPPLYLLFKHSFSFSDRLEDQQANIVSLFIWTVIADLTFGRTLIRTASETSERLQSSSSNVRVLVDFGNEEVIRANKLEFADVPIYDEFLILIRMLMLLVSALPAALSFSNCSNEAAFRDYMNLNLFMSCMSGVLTLLLCTLLYTASFNLSHQELALGIPQYFRFVAAGAVCILSPFFFIGAVKLSKKHNGRLWSALIVQLVSLGALSLLIRTDWFRLIPV